MKKNVLEKLDIYKLKTTEELLKYYKGWADNNKYNKDMVDWNYTAPQETVSILRKYAFSKNCKILDAGCGTGLVGIELKKMVIQILRELIFPKTCWISYRKIFIKKSKKSI